jgi:hypothetical protein
MITERLSNSAKGAARVERRDESFLGMIECAATLLVRSSLHVVAPRAAFVLFPSSAPVHDRVTFGVHWQGYPGNHLSARAGQTGSWHGLVLSTSSRIAPRVVGWHGSFPTMVCIRESLTNMFPCRPEYTPRTPSDEF